MPLETSGAVTVNWMKMMRQCGDLMQLSVDCSRFLMFQTVFSHHPSHPPGTNTWDSVILT